MLTTILSATIFLFAITSFYLIFKLKNTNHKLNYFSQILNSTHNPLFIADKNGKIVLANNSAFNLFETKSKKTLENKLQKIIHSLNFTEHTENKRAVLLGNNKYQIESSYLNHLKITEFIKVIDLKNDLFQNFQSKLIQRPFDLMGIVEHSFQNCSNLLSAHDIYIDLKSFNKPLSINAEINNDLQACLVQLLRLSVSMYSSHTRTKKFTCEIDHVSNRAFIKIFLHNHQFDSKDLHKNYSADQGANISVIEHLEFIEKKLLRLDAIVSLNALENSSGQNLGTEVVLSFNVNSYSSVQNSL